MGRGLVQASDNEGEEYSCTDDKDGHLTLITFPPAMVTCAYQECGAG